MSVTQIGFVKPEHVRAETHDQAIELVIGDVTLIMVPRMAAEVGAALAKALRELSNTGEAS